MSKEDQVIIDLQKMVKKDWGKKCREFNWFCASCSAYLAVEILTELYQGIDETKQD